MKDLKVTHKKSMIIRTTIIHPTPLFKSFSLASLARSLNHSRFICHSKKKKKKNISKLPHNKTQNMDSSILILLIAITIATVGIENGITLTITLLILYYPIR